MLKQKFIKNYSSVIVDEQIDNIDNFYNECLIWEKVLSANPLVIENLNNKVISAEKKISLQKRNRKRRDSFGEDNPECDPLLGISKNRPTLYLAGSDEGNAQ